MTTYKIQWRETSTEKLASEVYAHFYLLTNGRKVLLLEKGYGKDIHQCILQAIDNKHPDHSGIRIFLGRIRQAGRPGTAASLDQMLELLACGLQLRHAGNRGPVRSTEPMEILNHGLELFPNRIRMENQVVYRSFSGPRSGKLQTLA